MSTLTPAVCACALNIKLFRSVMNVAIMSSGKKMSSLQIANVVYMQLSQYCHEIIMVQ